MRCDGRFIMMDVAMSRWMGGGLPAILEFDVDDVTEALKTLTIRYKDAAGVVHEEGVPIPAKSLNPDPDPGSVRAASEL